MNTSQGRSVSRRQTPSGPAQISTHLLGPYPIVASFLERMNVESILRGFLGGARQGVLDHARTLTVLIHNLIVSPGPLYRIAEWAAPLEPHVLGLTPAQKSALNDDRVARALDALVSERARGIWFRLALRVIKQFEIATDRMHFDTTTVTFHGKYEGSVETPKITHGHNKDHRPDLKQLLFGLTVSSDGAVPLHHHVHSGNTSDDRVHQGNLEDLRRILGRDDFTYVADSKLCTADNLKHLVSYGGTFVTVMPRTWGEDKRFRKTLRESKTRWKEILRIPNRRRKDDPPDIFSTCVGLDKTESGYRLIWIRSSQKTRDDRLYREGQLRRAEAELGELDLKLNRRRLRSGPAIRRAVKEILKRLGMRDFLEVKLKERTQLIPRRLKRGRPRAIDPVRMVKRRTWTLKIRRASKALACEKRTDGVFPLITNLKTRSKREVLLMYKYQPYVEKRFSGLKTDLEIAPVYLKTPSRAAALVHAYFFALVAASLIERGVRQSMAREKIEALPLLPEGRMTKTPTCPRILENFSGIAWQEFMRGDEVIAFPIELTTTQKEVIRLLGLPPQVYK
ncbi:MAG: IS1634 family transposase [Planctomycetes bacterium]|nr:IS1634 family transposase [Planctomycetota bacterium]